MRIAFIGLRSIGTSTAGGIEKAVEELSTRLVKLGHKVTVFTRGRYDQHTRSEFLGVRLRKLPALYTKHLEAISNTILAVFCALRGYDIVHINATGPALLSFLPRMFGMKVVVTVHGLDWKREKWGAFAKIWLRIGAWAAVAFPHRTVVVSKTLLKHYVGFYRKKVTYIPNGVTLPEPGTPANVSNPLNLSKGSYVLFLSRLVPEKGCHTLISAYRSLNTDKKLVIVGPPTHSEDYAALLRQHAEGDDRVIFAGARFDAEKEALYRDAYLFVLPSTIEGMALVLLEAMSFGAGCLCSDIPENLEVIESVTGNTTPVAAQFKTDDVRDLRHKLEWLLSEPELVLRLGRRARTHVAESFNWDMIARQYLAVYEELVENS